MFRKFDKTPLLVGVTTDRWDAFGSPNNLRHSWLLAVLKKIGGIDESVPPGWYDFNLTRKGLKYMATLELHR